MKVKNVGFDTVQWLVEKGLLKSVSRSSEDYVPPQIEESYFTFMYDDWKRLTKDTGDFLECAFVGEATKGYDVEFEGDLPEELVRRLSKVPVVRDRDKEMGL